MITKDKRVDLYINKSADYAKPILNHIRELVHKACPDVVETIKWGFPSFDYKGPMCSMASFKQHCAFGFWKNSIMKDPNKIFKRDENTSMGSFGQLKSLGDLSKDKILIEYIKQAAKLNEEGIKLPARSKPVQQKELIVPDYFTKAINKNKKRLETAVEWMAEGKSRNWKYERK